MPATQPSTPADAVASESRVAPVAYRSPLLTRPGAVEGEGADAGVAWHYGDPVREQRLLEQGVGFVDLSHRGVVTVTGPDRLTWLHSLTTQQLADLPARTSVESLVLTPKGHVEHALHVVDDGETTWVTVEPGSAGALTAWLDRMRFMLRVEVADVTDQWAVLGEPVDRESVEGEPLAWVDPWPRTGPVSTRYAPVDDAEHPGAQRSWREVLVPRERLVEHVGDWDVAGTWASEALRVAAWRPRWGLETDHRTIPHEVDWLRTAVHLQKGCYRGQETVARVHNLGRPPRRLVMLHLDGSAHALPVHGAEVLAGGRPVGFVTSAARHHELGPVALALVKRSLPVDAALLVDGVAAAQETVVAP
ncbi:CAF17-like 4Fe-4S cluster assembly/insertion protein YgfZ [Thalassiella azotivora]